MAESTGTAYRRLFQIRILHHYWLDDGGTLFDLLPQARREERLLSYDMRPFLAVAPTGKTADAISGLGCIFKEIPSGCVLAAPTGATIPPDAVFEFALTVRHPDFHNYTALTLAPGRIYGIFYPPEKRIYRYKENVPLFSNLAGAARGAGASKALFLSAQVPALTAEDKVEALVVSGGALLQLTSDQPGATTRQLAAQATDVPVFAHQGDVPAVVPPAGLTGAPARGIQLTEGMPDELFALIRLSALRPDDQDFSLIDAQGHPKAKGPVFDIRFKSRSTVWQYFDKRTGAPVAAEASPLPLTFYGNAGTRQKPSEGVVKAERSGDRIVKLVSEIFV